MLMYGVNDASVLATRRRKQRRFRTPTTKFEKKNLMASVE